MTGNTRCFDSISEGKLTTRAILKTCPLNVLNAIKYLDPLRHCSNIRGECMGKKTYTPFVQFAGNQ